MRSLVRTLSLVAVVLSLSACIVVPTGEYYKPSYTGHSVSYDDPPGCPGPGSIAVIKAASGVKVTAGLSTSGTSMDLGLRLSGNTSVRFESDQIGFSNLASGRSWQRAAGKFAITQELKLPPTTRVSPQHLFPSDVDDLTEINTDGLYKRASISFKTSRYKPKNGYLKLPDIILDGETLEVPPIEFWEDGFYANQFYAVPIEFAGFTIETRLWSRPPNNNLNFSIQLFPPLESEWGFTSDQVKFLDLELTEQSAATLGKMRIALEAFLPITRILKNTEFVDRSQVEATLSAGIRRSDVVVVQLPALIVDGRRIEFNPITFKKTSGHMLRAALINC